MCGITGIIATEAPIDPMVLQSMNDRLAHRGPDGEGFLLASGQHGALSHSLQRRVAVMSPASPIRVALGHRRLAILDLSDRGLQPMSTRDQRAWIVFNGEIYNHRELRKELESAGHAFETRTDTEVLLQAYLRWGQDFLDRIDGMFAFALWDRQTGRLLCARDRLGIKPFYYATPPGHFVFGSEIKALLAFPGVEAAADSNAVVGFLVHGNCDYAERTLFRGIYALPAGHRLMVDAATGRIETRGYWRLEARKPESRQDGLRVSELRTALVDTVRSHLVSDVRAGSCLSGGLDSSTLVGVIGKLWREERDSTAAIGDRLYTFTSCYADKAFDEREYAMAIADSVGAQSHLVFPSAEDFWSDFTRIAWHQDMPFGALSFYAQWRVMRAAHEAGVKVLIDGQGGDEVFGGYAKFRYAYLASLVRSGRMATAARELAAMIRLGDRYVLDLRKGFRYLPASLRSALNVDSVLQRVLGGNWQEAVADESTPASRWWRNAARRSGAGPTLLQRIQVDDIVVDTLPQLLRMEDRSSMAFSLEARVPLLDHRVVELGVSLPDHLKVHHGWSKFAVREAMAGVLPDRVRWRKTKLGFAAPDRMWLVNDLREAITQLLAGDLRCAKFIDVAALRQWYGQRQSRHSNTESFLGLFRILSLEMWMRAFSV